MKRMLINATQPEELRVAIADGQHLTDLDVETPAKERKKSNIYKGKITHIEPSLEAAFVDYGADRHGFLPIKEVAPAYYINEPHGDNKRPHIKDVLQEGQEIIIQIDKEERGNKGAALTTYISLAGRYLVLMPNNPGAGGVSRRIAGEERNELREVLSSLTVPEDMGLIVRTAGVGKSGEELQWDLDYLVSVWAAIKAATQDRPAPFLVYQESKLIIRAIRDYLSKDVGEILIDDETLHQEACDFMQQVMPQNLSKLKFYTDEVPLFTRYQIESQIEGVFQPEVRLPSGGAIVIDHTEALIAIDINSGRATQGSDIEETALKTNMEAAVEIARQLRLRDLGGLVVIDFIDMTPARNQREVESCIKEALRPDRARIQVGRISRFGLLEMSRQRLRSSLAEYSQSICPRCTGRGRVRNVESLALSILRVIEEEAMKGGTAKIITQVPVNVATFLLNEKRLDIQAIESRQKIHVVLVPNTAMETPHYEVSRVKQDGSSVNATHMPSYEIAKPAENELITSAFAAKPTIEKPAVGRIKPSGPAPTQGTSSGILKRIFSGFGLFSGDGNSKQEDTTKASEAESTERKATARPNQRNRGRTGNSQRRNTNRNKGTQQKRPSNRATTERGQQTEKEKETQTSESVKKEIQNKSAQPESGTNEESRTGYNRRGRRGGGGGGRRRRNPSTDNTNTTNSEQESPTKTVANSVETDSAQKMAPATKIEPPKETSKKPVAVAVQEKQKVAPKKSTPKEKEKKSEPASNSVTKKKSDVTATPKRRTPAKAKREVKKPAPSISQPRNETNKTPKSTKTEKETPTAPPSTANDDK